MPSSRMHDEVIEPSDASDDPDYREDSDDGDEDDLPKSMFRDRAEWFIDNREAIAEVYREFLRNGRAVFGDAFLQLSTINAFGNFVYKYTSPGATNI